LEDSQYVEAVRLGSAEFVSRVFLNRRSHVRFMPGAPGNWGFSRSHDASCPDLGTIWEHADNFCLTRQVADERLSCELLAMRSLGSR